MHLTEVGIPLSFRERIQAGERIPASLQRSLIREEAGLQFALPQLDGVKARIVERTALLLGHVRNLDTALLSRTIQQSMTEVALVAEARSNLCQAEGELRWKRQAIIDSGGRVAFNRVSGASQSRMSLEDCQEEHAQAIALRDFIPDRCSNAISCSLNDIRQAIGVVAPDLARIAISVVSRVLPGGRLAIATARAGAAATTSGAQPLERVEFTVQEALFGTLEALVPQGVEALPQQPDRMRELVPLGLAALALLVFLG